MFGIKNVAKKQETKDRKVENLFLVFNFITTLFKPGTDIKMYYSYGIKIGHFRFIKITLKGGKERKELHKNNLIL